MNKDYADNQDAAGQLEEVDEAFTLKKGGYKRKVGRPSLEDGDDVSGEERYGLRGRKKRQKGDEFKEPLPYGSNKAAHSSANL